MLSSKSPNSFVKIQSSFPKRDLKPFKWSVTDEKKTPPEVTLNIKGNVSQKSPSENTGKVTEAWEKLMITTLSKAIAITPLVGACTIGPKSESPHQNDSLEINDCDELDLKNAVTSTPRRPKNREESLSKVELNGDYSNCSFGVSNLTLVKSDTSGQSPIAEHIIQLEQYRMKTQNKIEAQVYKSGEMKRKEFLKKIHEHDERKNENKEKLKMKLETERLLQTQEQCLKAERQLRESQANAQVKADKNKSDHEKRQAESNEKMKHMLKELKESREQLKQWISKIHKLQVLYNQQYQEILDMTKSCKDLRKLNERIGEEIPKLKKMNQCFLVLVERCKEAKVTVTDAESAQLLFDQIKVARHLFFTHTDKINKDFEEAEAKKKKEQEEKEARAKEEEEAQAREEQRTAEKSQTEDTKVVENTASLASNIEDCISRESLQFHLELSRFLEDYEAKLVPLVKQESLKKFRFDCQKAVNLPVNAISPLDDLHLEDKLYKLTRLLQGQAVPLNNTMFLVTVHPLGIPFCTNLLAKKFVKQGELAVSSKPEAAFAMAAVIVALWSQFPDFGRLLLAHFHRECPYLIPAFMPQIEGQSNEDYYRVLGYQYSEDGKVESQDKFLRRMSGVIRLYSAIMITPLKRSLAAEGRRHPHSLRDGWRWLSASLNLRPRPDISATLIYDFLEVTGRDFFRIYGTQFTKLLLVLCIDYFPIIEQVTPDGCGGPVVRLRSFLEKILKDGQVPPPPGLLPINFW